MEREASKWCTDTVRSSRLDSLLVTSFLALCACTPVAPAPSSTSPSHSLSTPAGSVTAEASAPSPSATAERMGPAPADCPGPAPDPRVVADFIGPVVFGPPLWAGFYAGYDAESNAYTAPDAPLTEHGWRIKILFLLEPDHAANVELVGTGVRGSDGVISFAIEGTTPSTTAVFDPNDPAIPIQNAGWREYPTYAYFPVPGCYALSATWPGGERNLGFGVGG